MSRCPFAPAPAGPGRCGARPPHAERGRGLAGRRAMPSLPPPAGHKHNRIAPRTGWIVAVTLDPGPRLQFGPKIVTGNESVRTERILAIAGINSGLYDPAVIRARRIQALRRRTSSNRPRSSRAMPRCTGDQFPLEVQVVERLPRRLGFGAEYSSIQGATRFGLLDATATCWAAPNGLRIEAEASGLGGDRRRGFPAVPFSFLRPATFNQANDLYADLVFEEPGRTGLQPAPDHDRNRDHPPAGR